MTNSSAGLPPGLRWSDATFLAAVGVEIGSRDRVLERVQHRQGLLVAFLASGGGQVPTPTPPSGYEGMLLKQRVVGLVGAECGWECSPITLVAVTTSYLVHG